jgi:hypothetical protein
MSERRVVILARADAYEGMERPGLGPDVPSDLVAQGQALERNQDIAGLRRFLTALARESMDGYDLVALGGMPGAAWDFLGFDVGETAPAPRSAIRHGSAAPLNAHGLFWNQDDAQAFREASGAAEIVPVQRLRRSAIRPGAMVWYTLGNEFDPGDPFGRIALTVAGDGAAELQLHSRNGGGSWTGEVADGVFEQVRSDLVRGDFPKVPPHPVPAGSAMRQLELASDDHEPQYAMLTERLGRELDGYQQAFATLDSLAVQLSSGAYKGAQDTLAPSVTNVRRIS